MLPPAARQGWTDRIDPFVRHLKNKVRHLHAAMLPIPCMPTVQKDLWQQQRDATLHAKAYGCHGRTLHRASIWEDSIPRHFHSWHHTADSLWQALRSFLLRCGRKVLAAGTLVVPHRMLTWRCPALHPQNPKP